MAQLSDEQLYVFIDANILLAFFEYSEDDLAAVRTLIEGFKQKKVIPITTRQLRDEVFRNRGIKINAALKSLREQGLDLKIPTVCKGYSEFEELKELQKQYSKKRSTLLKSVEEAVESRELLADKVIDEFFASVDLPQVSDALLERARRRIDLGNPPHKSNSIGDAVHWEHLLQEVPKGADIHLVSGDKDFASERGSDNLHEYLADEWARLKEGNAYLYRSLRSFFQAKLPGINLPSDLVRQKVIDDLGKSSNFSRTHQCIAALAKVDITSPEDAETILRAALENAQVRWIITDDDVSTYLENLLEKFSNDLSDELVEAIEDALDDRPQPPSEEYDPFADD
ncbi:MAG: DUF4935 domain-containing protein [Armatimonadetes bacterium]|nr:DUF4935 domain-containing protein [Armatimonadota bacterium]